MDPEQIPLRDLHLPEAIGWWPLAPGWWILIAIALVGLGFLIIVFWSPDGLLGLWEKLRAARARDPLLDDRGDS